MALRRYKSLVATAIGCWLLFAKTEDGLAQMSIYKIKGPYYPYWRLEAGKGPGVYDERSFDTGLGQESESSQAPIGATHVRGAVAFSGFETEVTYSAWQASIDWTKRQDIAIRENYYWPAFQWVQPAIGYFETRQTARAAVEGVDDPLITVPRNTGLIFGLSTRFVPSPWKGHGPVFFGRMDYRSALESKRNFGYSQVGGVGYQVEGKNLRLSIEWRVTRDFYNASREITTDPPREVGLRYQAFLREGWLGVHYWPFKKR